MILSYAYPFHHDYILVSLEAVITNVTPHRLLRFSPIGVSSDSVYNVCGTLAMAQESGSLHPGEKCCHGKLEIGDEMVLITS